VRDTDAALAGYEFSSYAQGLYDFIWRDLCDWYIEAIKPTVQEDSPHGAVQRRVLALCIDASLRLLHPVMPFVTEKLWERLNEIAPIREISGVELTPSGLLILAAWPKVAHELIDPHADAEFALVQQVITAIRQVRTTYQVPPKQRVKCSAKASGPMAQRLLAQRLLIETLANIEGHEIGPGVEKPADAAATVVDDVEIYVHGLVRADAEKARLSKRLDEVAKNVAALQGRLSNAAYTDKAPPHLVQQTRDQLAAAEREKQAIEQQLAGLC
jgi:valyl-tRNA synthetase